MSILSAFQSAAALARRPLARVARSIASRPLSDIERKVLFEALVIGMPLTGTAIGFGAGYVGYLAGRQLHLFNVDVENDWTAAAIGGAAFGVAQAISLPQIGRFGDWAADQLYPRRWRVPNGPK